MEIEGITTIIIAAIAFWWLLIETHWLTIRLPLYFKLPTIEILVQQILPIIVAAGAIIFILKKYFRIEMEGKMKVELTNKEIFALGKSRAMRKAYWKFGAVFAIWLGLFLTALLATKFSSLVFTLRIFPFFK